jgi:uncharacterized iron-regulated protein
MKRAAVLWAAVLIMSSGCQPHPRMPSPHDFSAAACEGASAKAAPTPGGFLDAAGMAVEPALVSSQAARCAYVLIGEGHPVACDHLVQARFLEMLAEEGAPPAVGLEMVSLDNQPVLDLFNKGFLDVDDMEAALKWDRTWGFPFESYRPVFEAARAHGLPLFALNAPSETVRKAAKVGLKGLPVQERLGLPGRIIDVPQEQETYLREVFEQHHLKASAKDSHGRADKDREAAWKRFVTMQALWDTTMAHRALEARVVTRRPVVILAGGGHVERGWGIASRLAALDPQGARFLVMPWRGGLPPDPSDADVFFYCPQAQRQRLGLAFEVRQGRVTVTGVVPGSPAEAAGIAPGDVVSKAQGMPVVDLQTLHEAAVKSQAGGGAGSPLHLEIIRAGHALQIDLRFPSPPPPCEPGGRLHPGP